MLTQVLAKLKDPVTAQLAGTAANPQRRGIFEELLQVVTGDEPATADFDIGQVAATHLVVQPVSGKAGEPGGFVDGEG